MTHAIEHFAACLITSYIQSHITDMHVCMSIMEYYMAIVKGRTRYNLKLRLFENVHGETIRW